MVVRMADQERAVVALQEDGEFVVVQAGSVEVRVRRSVDGLVGVSFEGGEVEQETDWWSFTIQPEEE